MKNEELKPCPFCGGNKNVICHTDYNGRDAYAVSCRYPECHGGIFTLGYGYFADKAEATVAWNTRAPVKYPMEDDVDDIIQQLRAKNQ